MQNKSGQVGVEAFDSGEELLNVTAAAMSSILSLFFLLGLLQEVFMTTNKK